MKWFKAKLFLILIALVWGALIYTVWPLQLALTVIGALPIKALRDLRYRFWIWQDNGVNVLVSFIATGEAGNPDVTVSSKVGMMSEQGSRTARYVEIVIDWLFLVAVGQRDHCKVSIERDEIHYGV